MQNRVKQGTREKIATALLILFAFAAWNLTGLATSALFLLLLLFLYDLPRNWAQLHSDPGFRLMIAAFVMTAILSARGAWMFPETATSQWGAIWEWGAPFLFPVIAWWLRGNPGLTRALLIAATAGLLVGVLRKSDWSELGAMLLGYRGGTGYTALGLGFLASQVLLGLFLFQKEIVRATLRGRQYPLLAWALWLFTVVFFLVVLLATQARGAVLSLLIVTIGYSTFTLATRLRSRAGSQRQWTTAIAIAVCVLALASTVLWTARDRIATDLDALQESTTVGHLSYESSLGTRLNLYRIGLDLFAERPLLGWGPGTSPTRYLVPAQVIPLSQVDQDNAPQWSHLHSVVIELLVRFGTLGVVFAVGFLTVMRGAYQRLQGSTYDQPLARLLLLGGIMALLYSAYDFRLTHVDMRFFVILFCGILYRFRLPGPSDLPASSGTDHQS